MSPSVAARALKEEPILSAGQPSKDTSSKDRIDNPLIYSAAQSLIDLHRRNPDQPVKIEIFDVPHDALLQVSEQLDELGASHHVRNALITALKDYVMSKGGSFARAANAKPVYIAIQVADSKPDSKFEQGVTEIAAVDGLTSQVEGAASINVRLTNTGTVMTSNIADVDRMFAGVKGDKLWIQFEAPTKEELAGLLNQQELALAAVGETIGGAISAAELEDVLQKLQDEGPVTAEIVELLENMIEMRALVEAGVDPKSEPRIAELSQKIADLVKDGLETGSLPVLLAKGAVQSIETLVETHKLEAVIPMQKMEELSTQVNVQEIAQKIEGLIEVIGPDDVEVVQVLEAIVEALQNADANDLSEVLSQVSATIAELQLPESAMPDVAMIDQIISSIKSEVPAVESATPEIKVEMAAQDLLELLQSLDTLEDLPPELEAQLVKMEEAGFPLVEITPDQIVQALNGKAAPALNEAIQNVVLALNDPAIQKALPQTALNSTNYFLNKHADVVETVTVQAVITNLSTALESANLTQEQVEVIQAVVAKLESGEGLKAIAPETLKEIVTSVEGVNKEALSTVVNVIENTQTPNVVVSQETIAKVESIAAFVDAASQSSKVDLEEIEIAVQDLKKDLTTALESGTLTPEQAEIIQTVVTKLESGEGTKSITPETLKAVVTDIKTSMPSVENSPVKWDADTLMNLKAMADLKMLPAAANDSVREFLKSPNDPVVVTRLRTEMGDLAPPQVIAAYIAKAPMAALAAEVRLLSKAVALPQSTTPLTAQQKKPYEAMKAVTKILESLPSNQKMTPAQAEVLLRKIDEGRVLFKGNTSNEKIDIIRDAIMDRTIGGRNAIPEDVVKGKCPGCDGGKCGSCSTGYGAVAQDTKILGQNRGLNLNGTENLVVYSAPEKPAAPIMPIMHEVKLLSSIAEGMKSESVGRMPTSEEKLYVESFKSVERSLTYFAEKGITEYTAIQAEVMIRHLNQGLVGVEDLQRRAQIEQTIEKIMDSTIGGRDAIPEDVRTGKCIGCKGGACPGCGTAYSAVAAETEILRKNRGLSLVSFPEVKAA